MPLFRDILGLSYYPLRIINKVSGSYRRTSSPRLRVLSYHDISEADKELFERQLRWVMKSWDIVNPDVFAAMIDGEISVERDTLLLTFDDGTVSNLYVAERILKPLGIHALFFIVAKYALLGESDDWRTFGAENIFLNRNPDAIPDNFRNMSIEDLMALLDAGHTIGAHTATHARLSTLSEAGLQDEIVGGANLLEAHLGIPVRHFAYPFGDLDSISAKAIHFARQRFKYVYTGMRGDNGGNNGLAWHIRRDSNKPHDSLWYTGACLEGGADFLYEKKLRISKGWAD